MKILFIIVLMLGAPWIYGQADIHKSALMSAGADGEVNGISMTSTLGEWAVREDSIPPTGLSEGFIGPDLAAMMGIEGYAVLTGLKLYPVPVKDYLHIRTNTSGQYEIYLFDTDGHMLMHREWDQTEGRLNLTEIKPGNYLIYVVDRENRRATYVKIIKT
ncbi:MAG: T9SS type A sorting domain-containing protein [Chlorobi bacterium]|nr:T9SS type A sorting domain-containing protein [Chlorobiota bacterium]